MSKLNRGTQVVGRRSHFLRRGGFRQVDRQFAFGIGADLIEPFAPVSADLGPPGLGRVATLAFAGVLREVGDGVGRAAESVGPAAEPAQRVVGLDHDVDIGVVQALDQNRGVADRGTASEGPQGRSPHFGPRVAGESFQPVLLADELFAIADLDGFDDGLLNALDLGALGVLEFREELIDRRIELADLNAVARAPNGRIR